MERKWVKLQTDTFKDSKVKFVIKRYGWDCWGVFSGLMMESDEGVLTLPEEVFADSLFIEEKRFEEIILILEKYEFVFRNEDNQICLKNWFKYQSSMEEIEDIREKERLKKAAQRAKNSVVPALSPSCPENVPEVSPPCPALDLDIDLDKEVIKENTLKGVKEKPNGTEQAPASQTLGEFQNVKISLDEEHKLIERLGESRTKLLIENLSAYLAQTRKRYASHYATILNWDRMDKARASPKPSEKKSTYEDLMASIGVKVEL